MSAGSNSLQSTGGSTAQTSHGETSPKETTGVSETTGGTTPTTSGNTTYTYTEELKIILPSDSNWYPYRPKQNEYGKILAPGETYVVENTHFKGEQDYSRRPLTLIGEAGSGQTVIIRANKFTNIEERAIFVKNVETLIVEGNYFENVGGMIKTYNINNLTVRYNKVKNHGIMPVYGTFQHLSVINDTPRNPLNSLIILSIPAKILDISQECQSRTGTVKRLEQIG